MSTAPEPSGELPEAAWLVMGDGALKGLAHIGAWKAVQEVGVPVTGLIGTSIVAMVGRNLFTAVGQGQAFCHGRSSTDQFGEGTGELFDFLFGVVVVG